MSADQNTLPPVPLCDIQAQYQALKPEIEAAVLEVMASGQAIMGPVLAKFEQEAADYCGVQHAIGCADGTNALLLALQALDIGPGDEVILPPFTFFATVGSVVRVGAKPVFADIDPITFNLDPAQIVARLTPRTKAIIPVHLFGQCADMEPIWDLAKSHDLYVIEDAAQAFGATYRGKKTGGLGHIGCFSFYPSKNLGTLGDGGMVTTDNDHLAAKLKALRVHGSEQKYFHRYVGWNARLDAIHAAILRVKLPHVDGWLNGRRQAAQRYDRLIEQAQLHGEIYRPVAREFGEHTYNQYVIRVAAHRRDPLVAHLKEKQIGCDIYYPLCLHQQECLQPLGHKLGDFPHAEEAARSVLALPMFPDLSETQQRRVVEACGQFLQGEKDSQQSNRAVA